MPPDDRQKKREANSERQLRKVLEEVAAEVPGARVEYEGLYDRVDVDELGIAHSRAEVLLT